MMPQILHSTDISNSPKVALLYQNDSCRDSWTAEDLMQVFWAETNPDGEV